MDTELARTFLAIVDTGSFVATSERLHLTQSTISARVRRLEQWLGAELFYRERNGCSLTPAGRRFQRHALLLSRLAEQARREVQASITARATLTVGGRPGLWEAFLCRWLGDFAPRTPGTSVRALMGHEDEIMQAMIDGEADAGILYVPEPRAGLAIEVLFEDVLLLVSTDPGTPVRDTGYVYVDWGPQFLAWHARAFPELGEAAIAVNTAWLGLQQVLAHGGSGYFPQRLLRDPLQTGALQRVPGAPEFRLPAYLCHPAPVDSATLSDALESIRDAARRIDGIDA